MKTRSNMPLFVVECEDVKALSNTQIDLLRCGDYLVKKDASGEHAYKVTYKSDTGMCITYYDASVIETQSYDKIDGVWTYNSEDKTPNLLDLPDDADIKALAKEEVEDAPSGTIVSALGLDADGDLVKGTISGGTQLYMHTLAFNDSGSGGQPQEVKIISTTNTKMDSDASGNYTDTILNNFIKSTFGTCIFSGSVRLLQYSGTGPSTGRISLLNVYINNGTITGSSKVIQDKLTDTVTAL